MLNRIENRIMGYIFSRCRGKRTVLIPPEEILKNIALNRNGKTVTRYEITKKQLETHMKNIVLDGYLDYSVTSEASRNKVLGDSQGSYSASATVYVVTLTTRGEAFKREHDERRKRRWQSLGWKILLTIIAFGVSYTLWHLVGRN